MGLRDASASKKWSFWAETYPKENFLDIFGHFLDQKWTFSPSDPSKIFKIKILELPKINKLTKVGYQNGILNS